MPALLVMNVENRVGIRLILPSHVAEHVQLIEAGKPCEIHSRRGDLEDTISQ